MRIAMISEHASPLAALGGEDAGGQNVHVAALACAMARQGHDITVYTRSDDPGLPDVVPMADGVRVVHVVAGPVASVTKDRLLPYMPLFGSTVARHWVRDGAPDLVHAHFWMSGVAARHAAGLVPVPVAQTFHALGAEKRRHQGDADSSPVDRANIEARLARAADLVIATSTAEREELLTWGVRPEQVVVVPCGVDLSRFDTETACEVTTRPRVVTLSRLVERKGVDILIRSLTMLPEAELVVGGGPPRAGLHHHPEARRLIALARDLGVADRVLVRGAVPHHHVGALLRSADVVACTPWYEPFGIVPLEAMACGRPVVAAAVGGLVDTVRDGVTGLLVPPRDPDSTARAIERLLADPALAEEMSVAGRRLVEETYGWERVAARTLAAYQSVARRARPARPGGLSSAVTAKIDGSGRDNLTGNTPNRTGSDWLDTYAPELASSVSWAQRQGLTVDRWGTSLADVLLGGGRVLAAGNGGSAAEAQHFTAELVGRFLHDRRPLSALCLSAETSSMTAISNDLGPDEVFARQVAAHGRRGDVLLLLSTSGRSANILAAAERAHEVGLQVLALTGPGPNALSERADDALCVPGTTSTIQETHLFLIHALCAHIDASVAARGSVRGGLDGSTERWSPAVSPARGLNTWPENLPGRRTATVRLDAAEEPVS